MNGYLIPANTKKGQLIFSVFRLVDLIIFGVGVSVTFLLLTILPLEQLHFAIIALLPGIICSLLVAPVAYYHNVLCLITDIYNYFTERKKFVWRGWCFINGKDEK